MKIFLEFSYLQLLDVLTTLAFLVQGVAEANPFVRWAMRQGSDPLQGLVVVKLLALGLGVYCVSQSRQPLLRRVNVFFAGLVAYNLVALILASSTA